MNAKPVFFGFVCEYRHVSAYPTLRRSGVNLLVLAALSLALAGCQTGSKSKKGGFAGLGMSSRECLARAMYFESNRSSNDGMLAVGTVVMNRVEAKKYGPNVCAVVGAKNQFAPGVLSRSMTEPKSRERALHVADQVLKGRRHPKVRKAEFFHTSGYEPGYNNMRYVSIEGGNAFYEKVKKGEDTGHLVRIARRGPKDIGDMIAVQETTMIAANDVAVPPPADEAHSAPPRPVVPPRSQRRKVAVAVPAPPVPEAPVPELTPSYQPYPQAASIPPPTSLGWQVGQPGRLY